MWKVCVIAHVRKYPFFVYRRAKYEKLLGGVRKIILLEPMAKKVMLSSVKLFK